MVQPHELDYASDLVKRLAYEESSVRRRGLFDDSAEGHRRRRGVGGQEQGARAARLRQRHGGQGFLQPPAADEERPDVEPSRRGKSGHPRLRGSDRSAGGRHRGMGFERRAHRHDRQLCVPRHDQPRGHLGELDSLHGTDHPGIAAIPRAGRVPAGRLRRHHAGGQPRPLSTPHAGRMVAARRRTRRGGGGEGHPDDGEGERGRGRCEAKACHHQTPRAQRGTCEGEPGPRAAAEAQGRHDRLDVCEGDRDARFAGPEGAGGARSRSSRSSSARWCSSAIRRSIS